MQSSANTTWYGYDDYDRLAWTIQRINGFSSSLGSYSIKTINYKYNYDGTLSELAYQKESTTEDFFHYYTYDRNGKLTKVQTSTDGVKKEEQATYSYYKHGPMKRIELANKLQGVDYVYTINGWLKSINHPELNSNDPGKDGTIASPNKVAKDLFGMTLDYYAGDYLRLNTNIQTFETTAPTATITKDLFNGLIKSQRWKTAIPSAASLNYTTEQLIYGYKYDAKYQLTDANFGTVAGGTLNGTSNASYALPVATFNDNYKVWGLDYDPNGNLLTLNRNGHGASTLSMDKFSYKYPLDATSGKRIHNRLGYVDDQGDNADADLYSDIRKQYDGNYTYDVLGRITQDIGEKNKYQYDFEGNITGIYHSQSNYPKLTFLYDNAGHRIKKTSYVTNSATVSLETWYIRDASGNLLSTFNSNQTDYPIVGASRIGTYTKNGATAQYIYELNDHLGNVRTTFRKKALTTIMSGFEGTGNDYLFTPVNVVTNVGRGASISSVKVQADQNGSFIKIPVKTGQVVTATIYYQHNLPTAPSSMLVMNLEPATGTPYSISWVTQPVGAATGYGSANWLPITKTYTIPAKPAGVEDMVLYVFPWSSSAATGPVWYDDISITITPYNGEGGIDQPEQLNLTDYYPHGSIMKGRSHVGLPYKNGYQGQFTEKDETGLDAFDLRAWDGRLARWTSTDPYNQYHSPYLGMGNDPVNMIDPDGGFGGPVGDWLSRASHNVGAFFSGKSYHLAAKGGSSSLFSNMSFNSALTGLAVLGDLLNSNQPSTLMGNGNNKAQSSGSITFPSFSDLWKNYPGMKNGSYAHPSSNPAYLNQCAIRMSECLIKSGVSLTGYPADDLDKDFGKWALTANRLKYYISQNNKNFKKISQADFESKYWNQTGIIYIEPPSGGIGHIDLFNKGVTGSGKGGPQGAGYYLGTRIWFWDIK